MRYLTIDEIFAIHDRAIQEYGGSPELADLGRLEAALAAPPSLTATSEPLFSP